MLAPLPPGDCLDENVIADLLRGSLSGGARSAATLHLESCDGCRALVAALARSQTGVSRAAPAARLASGALLGHYAIVGVLGAGATGFVYSAHDQRLDRKVALKLLRTDAFAEASGVLRARLLREAQALARLQHPNVIAVHEVGESDGQVFIAMELVEGETLRAWLHAAHRSRGAVLEVFRQAGLGLQAAHEKGLVHRDFKPENVLVGRDGRVRVTDFGLAYDETATSSPSSSASAAAVDPRMTATGALLGTPAYMAPEQLAGKRADARSDQFAFCVALHEALAGERPFAADSVEELRRATSEGLFRPLPRAKRGPNWLRRILLRGLSTDPARRFPSMAALLAALASDPGRRLRLAALGVVVVAALAVLFATQRRTEAICSGGSAAFASAWDAPRRAQVHAAFLRSQSPSAEGTFAAAANQLDAYRDGWIKMYGEACRATRVRGEQSEALLDLRMRCLAENEKEAAALTNLLAEGDRTLLDNAPGMAMRLSPIERCANSRALLAVAPLPDDPAKRAEIDLQLAHLTTARALNFAGQQERTPAMVQEAIQSGRRLGFTPLLARALFEQGRYEWSVSRYDDAVATVHESAAVALEARDDAVAADAWTMLGHWMGTLRMHHAEGRVFARYAEAAVRRLGGDDEREGNIVLEEALMLLREGALQQASEAALRARALFVRAGGPEHYRVASADEAQGNILFEWGRSEEAYALHQRSGALREKLFGPDGYVIGSLLNEGEDLARLGRFDESLAIFARLRAMQHAGADDGYLCHRLADALRRKGDLPAALVEDRRSLNTIQTKRGPDARELQFPYLGVGLDLLGLQRPREAVAPLEASLALREKAATPFELAEVRFALARALWESPRNGATAPGPGARARSLDLAARASADYRDFATRYGHHHAALLAEIDRWREVHAGGSRAR